MCFDLSNETISPFECLFIWPIAVPSRFTALLASRAPIALVLAAHYAVLLHGAGLVWFIGSWGREIVEEVTSLMPGEMRRLVDGLRELLGVSCPG